MAHRKLERVLNLDKARTRLAALKSIDNALDLGNGMTVTNFETEVDAMATKISAYNTALSVADDLHNQYVTQLRTVLDLHERMLTGVATRYGKNSSEYEMAGGVRKAERKRPKKL